MKQSSLSEGTVWAAEKSLLTVALRQNQLWFPVTSLVQYVRHELKGGQENGGKAQQEESETLFWKDWWPFLSIALWQDQRR